MGFIELYLIYDEGGTWEEQWRPLQGLMDLPIVSKETMDHALQGWTRPFVDQLGPPPNGMLHKLSVSAKRCSFEITCPFYDKRRCFVLSEKVPWCFEPTGISPGNLAAEVIKLWKQGVYVIVIREDYSD
jgi:hypothetical protein